MQSTPKLGKVQLQIMQVLWDQKRATAREITDALNANLLEGQAPIAHSTVQTLLRKMEAKGAVGHHIQDRVFVFEPLHEQNEVATGAVTDLLTRLFDRSISGLVAHLVKQEKVSPEELERLRQIVAEADVASGSEGESSTAKEAQ